MSRIIFLLTVLIAVFAIVGYRVGSHRSIPDDVTVDPESLEEAFQAVARIEQSVREIYYRVGIDNKHVTLADEELLTHSVSFLDRIAKRKNLSSNLKLQAYAAAQRAHVSWLMDQQNHAEIAFRQSLGFFEKLLQEKKTGEFLARYSEVCNSLCCFYGERGDYDEALTFAIKATSAASESMAKAPENLNGPWQKALALRNQAIVLQLTGNDGTIQAIESADSFSRYSELDNSSNDSWRIHLREQIVDSYQILSLLLHQQKRYVESQQAGKKASEFFRKLQEVCFDMEEYGTLNVNWERYRQLEARLAKYDLDEQFIDEKTPLSQFMLLSRITGRSLHPDLLAHGHVKGEFETQESIVLVWPLVKFAKPAVIEIIRAIQGHVGIKLLVQDSRMHSDAVNELQLEQIPVDEIQILVVPTDTVWLRDYGPLTIHESTGMPLYIDAKYNLIGKVYRYQSDNVPFGLEKTLETPRICTSMFAEWGAMAFNGDGLAIVSSEMLLMNRMVGFDEDFVTKTLKRLTGVRDIEYVDPLIDETTGHVDLFLTFPTSDTLVLGEYKSGDPDNGRLLDQHAERFSSYSGKLKIERIPMPPRQKNWFGGSYTNVVYANDVLLVPSWPKTSTPELEQEAINVYQRLLPEWKIVPIDCERLGSHGGSLHCITMNIPASRPK